MRFAAITPLANHQLYSTPTLDRTRNPNPIASNTSPLPALFLAIPLPFAPSECSKSVPTRDTGAGGDQFLLCRTPTHDTRRVDASACSPDTPPAARDSHPPELHPTALPASFAAIPHD